MSDRDAMWTCFRHFLFCLRLDSFVAEGADDENAYIGGADTVEYSRIYSQFFSILEVKLFNTG